ncbi:MAG: RNA methyltransferase [Alphaproteobacteria bacterium]|nr:RNA methyltransferase [Alphaproteobacteria bacterium]
MAGTDRTRPQTLGGPAIILVDPQLGENIGFTARAMLNCGLSELRLVRPRDGWPNAKARSTASGADAVLGGARLFETTSEAVADLGYVLATTARQRDMEKIVLTPAAAAAELRDCAARGTATGVLFGAERAGLDNEDVTLADAVLQVPLNPAYASLSLPQAVLLVAHAYFIAGDATPGRRRTSRRNAEPAERAALMSLFGHLEGELDAAGFFAVPGGRPVTVRNLRNIFTRTGLTTHEIGMLRGIISALGRRGGG